MTNSIQRYSLKERICHWTNGLVYCYCLATGLSLYTPHLFWIAFALGGGGTSRFWHPIIGVVFAIALLWMWSMWSADLRIEDRDREWLTKAGSYAENRDSEVPPQGRFNAGQKIFFLAMLCGMVGLLLSGVVLWFPEYVPAGARWLRGIAILVHEAAAFIVHVYMSVFVVPGSMTAMVFGHVSRAWARAHHRLWADQQR